MCTVWSYSVCIMCMRVPVVLCLRLVNCDITEVAKKCQCLYHIDVDA